MTKIKSNKKIFANPDKHGYYGDFGGAFIPEMLYPNVKELRENYLKIIATKKFKADFDLLLKEGSVRALTGTSTKSGSPR